MTKIPILTNVNFKTSEGMLELQASDIGHLQQRLKAYFGDEFKNPDALSTYTGFQKILNRKAKGANHLSIYDFDPDQRVGELVATLAITATINRIHHMQLIPGFQRPGQQVIMQKVFGKKSWDGFMYENPTDGTDKAFPTFVEVKSTMVGPDEDVMNPNELMNSRLEQYKEHFQSPDTICAVFIMPYTSQGQPLRFDLKDATEKLNEVVAVGAMGSVCLLSFPSNESGKTVMTVHCYLVNKSPKFGANDKIDSAELGKLELAVF
jgi:hypothetical protein